MLAVFSEMPFARVLQTGPGPYMLPWCCPAVKTSAPDWPSNWARFGRVEEGFLNRSARANITSTGNAIRWWDPAGRLLRMPTILELSRRAVS